ncbi:MAG TPA: TIGR01212 family radical SAM protein [Spirochaetota bacterium]|nr:TIGR01212 family radical SAM protein [Spirochaetota bacterium]HOM37998.1 TIGR01212 family radical SAM protein [Spirochaetota bacterium]HPQ48802.1 TIGR01212 family radical SAM protein [Spirochaetota bacterium]
MFENRYYSFSSFLKKKFGGSVYKISIDAGFTCPNRDGSKGFGGCYFCNNSSFSGSRTRESVKEQIRLGKERLKSRKPKGFIAYFQSFTNTYANVSVLKKLYCEALEEKDILGISIGTRADCLPEDVLDLLSEISKKTMLWIELGLESIYDTTLKRINRGHTYEEFKNGYYKLRERVRDCYVCFHVIFGLPGENKEMMINTVKEINRLKPDAIKFHQLEIVKNTQFEKEYYEGKIEIMIFQDYLGILGEALKILSPAIIIQRLYNTTNPGYIVAPKENLNKKQMLDIFLKEKNIIQGSDYNEEVYKV